MDITSIGNQVIDLVTLQSPLLDQPAIIELAVVWSVFIAVALLYSFLPSSDCKCVNQ